MWTLELDFCACSRCSVVERRSMMLVMLYLEVRASRSDWEALSYGYFIQCCFFPSGMKNGKSPLLHNDMPCESDFLSKKAE